MIKVLFFAQVRELVACDELSLPCDYATAEQLRAALCERGDKWALALEAGKLLGGGQPDPGAPRHAYQRWR